MACFAVILFVTQLLLATTPLFGDNPIQHISCYENCGLLIVFAYVGLNMRLHFGLLFCDNRFVTTLCVTTHFGLRLIFFVTFSPQAVLC